MKIMLDGVAENHTAAMLAPYLDGCGSPCCGHGDPAHVLDTSGLSFIDPERAEGVRHRAGQGRIPGALPRTGRPGRARGAGRGRRRPDSQRLPSGARGTTWLTCRSSTPTTCPASGELGAARNMQPLWAAHEPQMDELTIPFLGAQRAAWQYPFGDLRAAGRHAWSPAATGR